MQLYFLKVAGQLNGPFTLAQLRTMISSGAVTRQSILVDEYTKREVEAGDIVALFEDAVDVMKQEVEAEEAAAIMEARSAVQILHTKPFVMQICQHQAWPTR